MEKTCCKIICDAPTTLAVKELMMMMMNHFDDGEKKDINDLSNVVCWVSTLCNDLTSRQGFVRLLSEFVSTGVISSEVSWRTFGTRYIFPHLLCLAACERTQRVIPSVSSDSKEVIDYIR